MAFMIMQWRRVLVARLSALPALVLRCVQRVLLIQTELLLLLIPQLVVSIYFDYNYM